MNQFKPAPKPVHQRIASNFYIIGTLIFLIIGGIAYYLQSQTSTSPTLAENTITRDESFDPKAKQKAREVERQKQALKKQIQQNKNATPPQSEPVTPQVNASSLAPSENPTQSLTTPTTPLEKIAVSFYELSREELSQLISQGKVISESTSTRTSLFTNAEILKTALGAGKKLPGGGTYSLKPGEAVQILFSNIEEQGPISWELNFEMTPNKVSSDSVNYQFRGDFYFASESLTPPPVELPPESHTIARNGAVIVAGMIPHIRNMEEADGLPTGNPLSILGSLDFKDNLTEFVIYIKPAP